MAVNLTLVEVSYTDIGQTNSVTSRDNVGEGMYVLIYAPEFVKIAVNVEMLTQRKYIQDDH